MSASVGQEIQICMPSATYTSPLSLFLSLPGYQDSLSSLLHNSSTGEKEAEAQELRGREKKERLQFLQRHSSLSLSRCCRCSCRQYPLDHRQKVRQTSWRDEGMPPKALGPALGISSRSSSSWHDCGRVWFCMLAKVSCRRQRHCSLFSTVSSAGHMQSCLTTLAHRASPVAQLERREA